MKRLIFLWRETETYAFLIGFYERWQYVDGFGRSHESNQDWNEAYDKGANLADWLFGTRV